MAKFIPAVPESFNGSIGEEKAFEALRLLDDTYTVFHSFNWIGLEDRTQGEADFVIIHPQKGIMVVEVKAGEIEYKGGQWLQTNTLTRKTKYISPFNQASRSQFEILDRLKSDMRLGKAPLVCHAVWFTSIVLKSSYKLPPEAPREIVFDETSLNKAKMDIDKAFDYWAKKTGINAFMNLRQLNEVVFILAPHFHVIPGPKGIIDEAERVYIKLTKQQTILLDYLKEQKTAAIHGLAGTGKTILAREKSRELASDGELVLFLCYNSFLKEFLRKHFSQPCITFHNIHSLANEILNENSISGNKLIEEFEEYLSEVIEPEDWPYKHIIIDEGQDLNDKIIMRLSKLTAAKGGSFYVFYDRNQYVMKNERPKWLEQAECKLVLHRNCRNTAEIFKTSCSLISIEGNIYDNSVHGEIPGAVFVANQTELLNEATKFVQKAISSGVQPDEVVFLTVETEKKSWLSGVTSINKIMISNEKTEGNILFTSVRKFKGLEAKAVMIVDMSVSSLTDPEKQRLAYVGCSRAKHLLKVAILDNTDISDFGDCLRKINSSRNVPKNKKGLARLLNLKIEN